MIEIKSHVEFDAAHFLDNSNTQCDVLHGHRWRLDVTLRSDRLTKEGYVINFVDLKKWMKEMTENIDHNLANFYLKDTTAECLCMYFFMCMMEKISKYNKEKKMKVQVWRVDIAETPNNVASFCIYDFDYKREACHYKALLQWADPEKRKRIHDSLVEANKDPMLRHLRSVRMQMDNPMSKREVVDRMLHSLVKSQKKYPNKGEKMLDVFFKENNLPLTYCGDGSFILMGKIPDFVNIEKKVVVEYNGRFWHSKNQWNDAYDDSQERIEHFKKYGYTCYIIWDDEFEDEKEQIILDLTELLK